MLAWGREKGKKIVECGNRKKKKLKIWLWRKREEQGEERVWN